MHKFFLTLFLTLLAVSTPARADTFQLEMPLLCEPGVSCWIQQYADHDAGANAKDFNCGSTTYDGHDGTDIRVKTTKDTAVVIAGAAGIVKGMRDGVVDHLMRSATDRAAVGQQECGNGVVIAHEGGWETQYCHMRQGSITVRKGDAVTAGSKLGEVGYSGAAAFPHLHLSLRKDGTKLDPFSGALSDECAKPDRPLWSGAATAALNRGTGNILSLGFLDQPPELSDLETGVLGSKPPQPNWPALLGYIWLINLQAGDQVTITLSGPQGDLATNSVTLDRHKAQYLLFAGKKRTTGGWPSGDYSAHLKIANGGELRLERRLVQRID